MSLSVAVLECSLWLLYKILLIEKLFYPNFIYNFVTGKARGPGRPKKKKFPNPKIKMGRPRFSSKSANTSRQPSRISSPVSLLQLEDAPRYKNKDGDNFASNLKVEDDNDDEIDVCNDKEDDISPEQLISTNDEENRCDSLSPTANAPSNLPNTSLSTLTSRFMKGKANPFANLMSQLKPAAASSNAAESDDIGSDSAATNADYKTSGDESDDGFKSAYQAHKKRKADNPKKNSGGCSSETIVPKKPKNLYMMLDLQNRGGAGKDSSKNSTGVDEYDFDDSEDGSVAPPKHKFESTKKSSKKVSGSSSSYSEGGQEESSGLSAGKGLSKISMAPYAETTSDEDDERQVLVLQSSNSTNNKRHND